MSRRITTLDEIDTLRTGLSESQKERAFISYGRAFDAFHIAGADDSICHERASAIALSRITIRDHLSTVCDSLYDGKWPSPGKGAPRNPYGGLSSFEYPGGSEAWKQSWANYLSGISDAKIFLGIQEWIWAVVDALEYNLDWAALDHEKIRFRQGELPDVPIFTTPSDYGESAWKDRGESISLEKVNFPALADIAELYTIYWAERKRKEVDGLFSTADQAEDPLSATGIQNDSGAELRYGEPSKMLVVSHDEALGILVTDTPILRFTPLPYKTEDGSIEWVAKKPEDFATADFLSQIPGKPIADLHPPAHFAPYPGADHLPTLSNEEGAQRMVGVHDYDPKNVRVDLDSGTIIARTIYFEDSTIRGILDGSRSEVSVGIYAFSESEEGELSGVKYTKKQTAPVYDHLAVVPRGRCGPTCSVPVSDAELGESINQGGENMPKNEQTNDAVMDPRTLTILTDEGSETIVLCPDVAQDAAEGFQARIDELVAARDSALTQVTDLETELATVKGERDGANDNLKAIEARLDSLENAEPKIDADQLFDERLDMVSWMKENVTVKDSETGSEIPYSYRGKTIVEMRRDALEVFLGEDEASRIKDESDDYVRARFDSLAERIAHDKGLPTGARNLRSLKDDNDEPAPVRDTSRTLDLHRNGAPAA